MNIFVYMRLKFGIKNTTINIRNCHYLKSLNFNENDNNLKRGNKKTKKRKDGGKDKKRKN